MDLDALMKTEYGHGYGRVEKWVFARLGLSGEDSGLYVRMMETLNKAIDEGNGAIKKLDLRLPGEDGESSLSYVEKRAKLSMTVSAADANYVDFRIRMPSVYESLASRWKYVYHLGKRGVDGLLSYLGLGIYAIQEKFGFVDVVRHLWGRIDLEQRGINLWWVDGDRRSFVMVENSKEEITPTATHFFQLGGGFWGSKPVSFEEAATLGQQKGRRR